MKLRIDDSETRRPCFVDNHKALFHCWAQVSSVVGPSMLKGGHPGGTVIDVVAVVEYEDGKVATVLPKRVQFIDNAVFEAFDWAYEKVKEKENA
jgi:hypothetical protein